jgi:RNA polymerase sigma-70 factor (ECF subfamily)
MNASPDSALLANLLGQTARGDRAAFSELYETTKTKLFGVIRRILIRSDLAEEALQESYVRIWSNASRYDQGQATAMTWMIAIARNQAIDLKRKVNERVAASAVALEDVTLAAPQANADDSADLRSLRECLGGLAENGRDMVLLAYHQGYSREELSARFNRPVATVKTILRRSLIALKECLDGRH